MEGLVIQVFHGSVSMLKYDRASKQDNSAHFSCQTISNICLFVSIKNGAFCPNEGEMRLLREENGCHGIGAGHPPRQGSDGVSIRHCATSALFRGGE